MVSFEIPYIGSNITGEILDRANKLLDGNEILIGVINFDKKKFLILTSLYLIRWDKASIFNSINRISFDKINDFRKSDDSIIITVNKKQISYKNFDQLEIDIVLNMIKDGIAGYQNLNSYDTASTKTTSRINRDVINNREGYIEKGENPIDILKRRYAIGEISKNDYDQMYVDLRETIDTQITCGGCGRFNLPESDFCIDCGIKLVNSEIEREDKRKKAS